MKCLETMFARIVIEINGQARVDVELGDSGDALAS